MLRCFPKQLALIHSSNLSRSFTAMDFSADGPFWGPQTSYLNFCEEDYVITRYIAEFINTFSSLIFAIYGVYGLVRLCQKQHATLSRTIPYFGLMGVGACSAGYHMTLKYHTQMCMHPCLSSLPPWLSLPRILSVFQRMNYQCIYLSRLFCTGSSLSRLALSAPGS